MNIVPGDLINFDVVKGYKKYQALGFIISIDVMEDHMMYVMTPIAINKKCFIKLSSHYSMNRYYRKIQL